MLALTSAAATAKAVCRIMQSPALPDARPQRTRSERVRISACSSCVHVNMKSNEDAPITLNHHYFNNLACSFPRSVFKWCNQMKTRVPKSNGEIK